MGSSTEGEVHDAPENSYSQVNLAQGCPTGGTPAKIGTRALAKIYELQSNYLILTFLKLLRNTVYTRGVKLAALGAF